MKTSAFIIFTFLLSVIVSAQSPQSFRYQAVARDNSGNVLANQSVSFRISILSGSVSGTVAYTETHTGLSTNAFGLVELEIGKGTPVAGTFSSINWEVNSYFVKIEMDPAGGTTYQVLSTSQLLSVPYALHAKTTETGDQWGSQTVVSDATLSGSGTTSQPLTIADNAVTSSKIADGTITGAKIAQQSATKGQVLKWNGSAWTPSGDESGPFISAAGITRNSQISDHFVFGSSSLDDITTGSDDNIRMFFNKSKGAFRAGEPYGTDWNNENVGNNSVAFGIGTKASGLESFAAGHITSAEGPYATSLGAGTNATGMASTAIGGATKATGTESFSMGYNTTAAAKSSVALGQYNIGAGNGTTWIATDPVFEIGIGSSDTQKANAMTVLKNGNVGIGPANPTSKLEVAGQVKITGGSPGAGKVLTSDANGLASWQTAVGLTLPFDGNCSSVDAAFSINQSGTGQGIYVYNPAETGEVTSISAHNNSSSGTGITAAMHASSGTATGILGFTAGTNGTGVKGLSNATTGANFGVVGESKSIDGIGVLGVSSSSSGTGTAVCGIATSPSSYSGFFNGGRFYIQNSTGIGIVNPTAKLDVGGQIKIRGGSPGAGKVLTSDASGLAVWQTPVSNFDLPLHREVASDGYVFSIANNSETDIVPKIAIVGSSNSGTGILGQHNSETGVGFGIYGSTSSDEGFSGYFRGGKFYVGGNTGIGTDSPSALLHTSGIGTGQGNVVFVGEYKDSDPGNPPVSGSGTRMMWYPDKAAFRAGRVDNTQWDAENVGRFSIATGFSNTASGSYSAAHGVFSNASGSNSLASGHEVGASGIYSTGRGSFIFASGDYSTVIGYNLRAHSPFEIVIGRYNTSYVPVSSSAWNGADRLFVIANGSMTQSSNAITVLKNGNTGIGTDNPSAKLEVTGQVKITGGSPGAGKVLTSDPNGLASWQNTASGPFSSSGGITSNLPITDHLVFGSSSLDDVSGTADDIRLFFNKTKGAFRAGHTTAGEWNDASVGQYSVAFGDNNKASGPNSFASGVASVASGSVTTAMGYFVNATAMLSTAFGSYNVGSGTKDSWVETDPIFEIGIGTLNVARSNAVTVLKNGSTGIGTHTPSQKLHIKGSAAGNAVLLIEPNKWAGAGDYGEVRFGDANHYIRGEHTAGMTFYDADKFNFSGGKVGIGTATPAYKLDVAGDRIRLFETTTSDWIALRTDGGSNDYLDFSWGGGSLVMQGAATNENIIMNPSMNRVGIRTWTPQYDLDVNGNIRATGSVYYGGTTTTTGTAYNKPDYVFGEDYKALQTGEIEMFLKENNHLPWVTSAEKEKQENGEATDMTRMAFETLESVENLQLQIISQQKLIKEQHEIIESLQIRLERIEKTLKTPK